MKVYLSQDPRIISNLQFEKINSTYLTQRCSKKEYCIFNVTPFLQVIRENWNLKYSACFVMCPLTNKTIPAAVSIVARTRDPPANLLAVINNHNETALGMASAGVSGPAQYKFGVCVKPLHFEYNRVSYTQFEFKLR